MKNNKKIIIILLIAVLVLSAAGCAAYKEHSNKYTAAVGEWKLDSIYVDTKPIKIVSGTLSLTKEKTGTLQVVTQVVADALVTDSDPDDTDTDDEVTANPDSTAAPDTATSTTYFSDAKNGEMTGTSDAFGTLTYEFNVDTEGEILHIYCMVGASQYHYIFIKADAE